jgi:hypothetical protein
VAISLLECITGPDTGAPHFAPVPRLQPR